jgi:quercetin dioxygenase-like cupin family protein
MPKLRFYYVLEGEVEMQVRGGTLQRLGPGQVFYESPEDVHTVCRNASKTKPAKFVVFFIKNEGAPILTPVHELRTRALNFCDETILHEAIFLTWRHV